MNRETPLVSIILTAYNAEAFLCECLDSIKRQSFQSYEVVAVNDGSTDKTSEILHNYSLKDERIHVYDICNKGAGLARNFGLEHSVGKYLIFLDADDVFSPEMLEECYGLAEEKGADIIFFKFNRLYMISEEVIHNLGRGPGVVENKNLAFSYDMFRMTAPNAWNKFFKKSFIESNKIEFQNLKSCNDIAFSWNALVVAEKVYFIDKEFVTYRQHQKSITGSRGMHAECILEAAKFIVNFIESKNKTSLINGFYKQIIENFKYELNNVKEYDKREILKERFFKFLPKPWGEKFLNSLIIQKRNILGFSYVKTNGDRALFFCGLLIYKVDHSKKNWWLFGLRLR